MIASLSLEVDLIAPYLVPKIQIQLPGIVGLVSLSYAKCQPEVTLALAV